MKKQLLREIVGVPSALDVVQLLQIFPPALLLIDAAHSLLLSARQLLLGERRVPGQAADRTLVVDGHVAALDKLVRRFCNPKSK